MKSNETIRRKDSKQIIGCVIYPAVTVWTFTEQ